MVQKDNARCESEGEKPWGQRLRSPFREEIAGMKVDNIASCIIDVQRSFEEVGTARLKIRVEVMPAVIWSSSSSQIISSSRTKPKRGVGELRMLMEKKYG